MTNRANVTGLQKRSIINDTVTTQDTTFSSTEIVRRLGQIEGGITDISGLQVLDMELVDELPNNANLNNLQAGTTFAASGQTLLNAPPEYSSASQIVLHTTEIDSNTGYQKAVTQRVNIGFMAFGASIFARLPNPAQLPSSSGNGVAFSPDGRYMAVAHTTSPFVTIYDWDSGVPVRLPNPAQLPSGIGNRVAWSPDGRYMAVAHNQSPFVSIYDWQSGAPIRIPDPAQLPASHGNGVAWSPDGRYMAVGHTSSPQITIYDWDSGVPVRLPNPTQLPGATVQDVAWSPSGKYIAAGTNSSPFVVIYDWDNGVPVRLPNPAQLPGSLARGVAWSPDSRYLAMGTNTSPFITIYDWDSGVPVRLPNPAQLPGGTGRDVDWSPDGRYMAVGHTSSPQITIYDWDSGVPVRLPNPAQLPGGTGMGVAWSPSGRYIAVGTNSSPFVVIYREAIRLQYPTNLDITNNILTWSAVANASGYRIYSNEFLISDIITNTTFSLLGLSLDVGVNEIQVRAISDNALWLDSELSDALTIIIEPPPPEYLDIPENLNLQDDVLVFDDVLNAAAFRIYVNGLASEHIITDTEFDLLILNLPPGMHKIQIRAISDSANFNNSTLSEAISFYVPGATDTDSRIVNVSLRAKINSIWFPWEFTMANSAEISQQQFDELKQSVFDELSNNTLNAIDVDNILDDILI